MTARRGSTSTASIGIKTTTASKSQFLKGRIFDKFLINAYVIAYVYIYIHIYIHIHTNRQFT